ncbi:MAG: electron transport complex subunit E [Bacteroidales bacterium]|jgi:electron transport complex protein RnfE|nr:electron transport complex subunit E [Bacteroidales bacterium]
MNHWENFSKGLMKENPIFVLVLGMCPTLATTTSALNGLSMGLATTFVLMLSNVAISLVSGWIPDKVRIPAYIVIIASFVTMVDMVMAAFVNSPGPNGEPSIYDQLGIFIPLIVVNCIVLGRAEAFAARNKAFSSLLDGAGIGLGFAFALTLLGSVREILGNGSVFGLQLLPQTTNILIFVLAPGAFIALGYLIVLVNKLKRTVIISKKQN